MLFEEKISVVVLVNLVDFGGVIGVEESFGEAEARFLAPFDFGDFNGIISDREIVDFLLLAGAPKKLFEPARSFLQLGDNEIFEEGADVLA